MKMAEVYTCVDKDGRIIIPEEVVKAAGLNPGDKVCVSLAASEDELHIPEDLLEAAGIPKDCRLSAFGGNGSLVFYNADEDEEDELDGEVELLVPDELLAAAGIPEDSDLDVICADGAVVILEADILDNLPDELRELFGKLGVDPDTVREVMRKEGYFV